MPFGIGAKPSQSSQAIDRFIAAFPPDTDAMRAGSAAWSEADTHRLLGRNDAFFTALMGSVHTSHGAGRIRFFLPGTRPSIFEWNASQGWHWSWRSLPPAVAFASDWLGNQYMIHTGKSSLSVERLDIGTGKCEVIGDLANLIGTVWPEQGADAFEAHLLGTFVAAGGRLPKPGQCVDYVVSPIAGGSIDDPANMKVMDLEIAVSNAGKLHEKQPAK
jgi:hypothetical protein